MEKPTHLSVKARSAAALEQRRRREDLLARQKRRRSELASAARGIQSADRPSLPASTAGPAVMASDVTTPSVAAAADASASPFATLVNDNPSPTESMDPMDGPANEEGDDDGMETTHSGWRRRGGKGRGAQPNAAAVTLMSAEWMVDVPVDLADCWYVLARPAGR